MNTERLFGLIGYPLGHSFSKKYFTEKFEKENLTDCRFELFPIENIEQLPHLLNQHPKLEGFSVTIPYKQKVLAFLDDINKDAREIGAVNCVRVKDGKLKGYNTDSYGFEQTLKKFISYDHYQFSKERKPEALILGTGGASKAVAYTLNKLEIPFLFVSRKKESGRLVYAELDKNVMERIGLIVNTTPLGTFPNVEESPDLPYEHLNSGHYIYDLVYNPDKTTLLSKAEKQGCRIINGLQMLSYQAEKAWEIWNE